GGSNQPKEKITENSDVPKKDISYEDRLIIAEVVQHSGCRFKTGFPL
nr:hypothetical protein [Tanacetum cinerariifolium]